jgi:pimeloyl-ACP methyl ester carboxylesterase
MEESDVDLWRTGMNAVDWTKRSKVNVGNTTIDIVESGAGKPLLMLHSGVSPAWPSAAYLDELVKTYRVIAPWHPGFGQSELPRAFTNVSDLAYTYLDLMDQLDLRDVTLVGASFGGWIAAEIAIRATSRLDSLILSAPFGIKVSDRNTRDILDFYAVSHAEWPNLTFADAEKWRPDYTKLAEPQLLEIARGRESLALFGWSPFMHNPRLRDWLHRIDVPTRIVWGRQDKIIGEDYAVAFAHEIPGAKLVVFDDAGHYPHIENPRQFADCVSSINSSATVAA